MSQRQSRPRVEAGRPTAATTFVGRADELAWLERHLEAVLRGEPRVLLVVGEAGIGKTRLVREFMTRARNRRVPLATGRAHEDMTVPLLPFVEALEPLLAALPPAAARRLGADGDALHDFVATGTIAPGPAAARSDRDETQLRLVLVVSRAILALARQNALVFVIDDLHWLDQASLELFGHVVFALSDAAGRERIPLLVVGTSRPVDGDQRFSRAVARFEREAICHTLELAGLSDAEVTSLVRTLGLGRPSHQLVTTVNETTRGNPLFIQEVVRHLQKEGGLGLRGGYVTTNADPVDLRLPAAVTGAIAARLRGLREQSQQLLTLAALLGDRFDPAVLGAVAHVEEDGVLQTVEEGSQQGLIESDGTGFRFTHPLVRHAFQSAPVPLRRRRLHLQIADALERLHAEQMDEHVIEIAHHLVSSGDEVDRVRLGSLAQRAADRAFAAASWWEAARFYEAALAAGVTPEPLTPMRRGWLHYRAGMAHFRNQDAGPAIDHLERAVATFREADEPRGLARALMGLARAHFTLASVSYGELIDPQPLLDVAERIAEDDPALAGFVHAEVAQVFWTARRPADAYQHATHALELGRRRGDDVLCAEAHRALSLIQSQRQEPRAALASLEQARAAARRGGDLWCEDEAQQRLALPLIWLGRLDEAAEAARVAGEMTRLTLNWGDHSLSQGALTCIAVARGDFDAAEHHAHQALMMRHRSGYPWAGPTALPALACARALRGAFTEAGDALSVLVTPGEVFEDPGLPMHIYAFVYRQLVRALTDPSEVTRADIRRSFPRPTSGALEDLYALGVMAALLDIAWLVDAPELAAPFVEVVTRAREAGAICSTGWVSFVSRVLGAAAALEGDVDRACELLTIAIDETSARDARPELARARLDLAQVLVRRGGSGDRQHAAELMTRALPLLVDLGMRPLLERAAPLARELGVMTGGTRAAAPVARWSPQDLAIVREIARGRDAREIARNLVLTPATVDDRLPAIMQKLGARTREEATRRAVRVADRTNPAADTTVLRAVLFTDLGGSTALIQREGDRGARVALRVHDRVVRQCLARFGGAEIKHTGDGIMAWFPTVTAGVQCAVAIQRGIARHNRGKPSHGPLGVRIGLDAGEPVAEDGDLFGAVVTAAARICHRARGGHILVSDVVRLLARGKDLAFVDQGTVTLRGFTSRCRLFEVPWDSSPS